MSFVGVAELLKSVAEAARSVTGPTFGLVVTTVSQVVWVGHGDGEYRECKKSKDLTKRKESQAERGCLQSGGLF
jgi:hypothetical protein